MISIIIQWVRMDLQGKKDTHKKVCVFLLLVYTLDAAIFCLEPIEILEKTQKFRSQLPTIVFFEQSLCTNIP